MMSQERRNSLSKIRWILLHKSIVEGCAIPRSVSTSCLCDIDTMFSKDQDIFFSYEIKTQASRVSRF